MARLHGNLDGFSATAETFVFGQLERAKLIAFAKFCSHPFTAWRLVRYHRC